MEEEEDLTDEEAQGRATGTATAVEGTEATGSDLLVATGVIESSEALGATDPGEKIVHRGGRREVDSGMEDRRTYTHRRTPTRGRSRIEAAASHQGEGGGTTIRT